MDTLNLALALLNYTKLNTFDVVLDPFSVVEVDILVWLFFLKRKIKYYNDSFEENALVRTLRD